MVEFLLLGCVLSPAQPANRPMPTVPAPGMVRPDSGSAGRGNDWVLTPRLSRGQELVYRGTYVEEATGARVRFLRSYRLETRFFVLDTPPRGTELAGLTLLHERNGSTATPSIRVEPVASSVRLERLWLDLQGKVSAGPGISLAIPLDGAPTLEVGAFVEVPRSRQAASQGWEVAEAERPPQTWRVVGTENLAGQACYKLVGVQQSDDWGKPRGDRGAWRRQDNVWVSPRTGLTMKVERIIEQCEPARREVTQRGVLRYDLESSMQCPAQLAHDRRQEITQALGYREAASPLLAEPGRNGKQVQALSRRVAYHLENQPPTPYRQAVLLIKRQLEAASRGEVLPVVHRAGTAAAARVAAIGEAAPEFVATEMTGKGSASLGKWKGKPILLVFYHPASYTAAELLRFAQELHKGHARHVAVVGLSVSDDTSTVLKQRSGLGLEFPVLHGAAMRGSYAVETTPKLILIDGNGIVRGMYLGWGRETPGEVMAELRRWLPGR